MVHFKDFGKGAKDLLGKNYSFGEHKLEVDTSGGDADFTTEWSSKGSSKMVTKYKLPNKTNLDIECASASKITGTLKCKSLFPGLTAQTKVSTAGNLFAGLEYVEGAANLTGDLDYCPKAGGFVTNASALFSQDAFVLGGSVKISPDLNLDNYNLGLGYSDKGKFEVTAKLSENLSSKKPLSLLVQYIHFVNSDVSVGATFSRDMIGDSPESSTAIGGTYKLSGGTKVGMKIDSNSKLGLNAILPITDNVTLTQSMQLDVADMTKAHKFGFNLKFKA